jgi:hypothetical protein
MAAGEEADMTHFRSLQIRTQETLKMKMFREAGGLGTLEACIVLNKM